MELNAISRIDEGDKDVSYRMLFACKYCLTSPKTLSIEFISGE